MKTFNTIKAHLADNSGDENVSKMIWIVIVFVVGGILLTLITTAFSGTIKTWFNTVTSSWFDNSNGAYDPA